MEEGTTLPEMKTDDTYYNMKPLMEITPLMAATRALKGEIDISVIKGEIYSLEVKEEKEILIADTMEQVDSSFSKLKATEDDITTAHVGNHGGNPSTKSGRDSLGESNTAALPGAGSAVGTGPTDGISPGEDITAKLLDHAVSGEPSTSSTPQNENIQASGQNLETHKTLEESLEDEEMRKAWVRVNEAGVSLRDATMDLFDDVYKDRRPALISKIDKFLQKRKRKNVPASMYREDKFLRRVHNSMKKAGLTTKEDTLLVWFKAFIKQGRTPTHGAQQRNHSLAIAPVPLPNNSQPTGVSTSKCESSEVRTKHPDPNQKPSFPRWADDDPPDDYSYLL